MNVPLSEIKEYLKKYEVPAQLQLNESTFIKDTEKFITTHISYLENNKGQQCFRPYYDRLLIFYNKVKENK